MWLQPRLIVASSGLFPQQMTEVDTLLCFLQVHSVSPSLLVLSRCKGLLCNYLKCLLSARFRAIDRDLQLGIQPYLTKPVPEFGFDSFQGHCTSFRPGVGNRSTMYDISKLCSNIEKALIGVLFTKSTGKYPINGCLCTTTFFHIFR